MSPRRRIQTDVPETDDRDGGPRRMPQTDVPTTEDQDGGKVLYVSLSVCLSVFYCDVVYMMSFDFIQCISLLSCYLFTFC